MVVLIRKFQIEFQSTLPSQGATDFLAHGCCEVAISIHAPLTGSDKYGGCECFNECGFQSTLPSQGATTTSSGNASKIIDFNPRSPHRERHCHIFLVNLIAYFNPRSPHRERHE